MDGWDGSPSQAATVPGYSLGLQCSHSASAPTRSHLTRQLGSWGASELRAEAGIGPEARIALPHRPFANTHEYVHACTAVHVCKSRAQHGGQAPSSRPGAEALFWKPFFTCPRLSHAHWTAGWPLHPCLLKSLAPPTTIFFPGPHNFISSFPTQCSQCLRAGRSSSADSTSLERPTPPATAPGACCSSMLGQAQTAYASRPIPPLCYYCRTVPAPVATAAAAAAAGFCSRRRLWSLAMS